MRHDATERPWQAFEKKAIPRTTFNLRLNDYELALLRWLAEQRDESMQKVAKRVLIPALERLVTDGVSLLQTTNMYRTLPTNRTHFELAIVLSLFHTGQRDIFPLTADLPPQSKESEAS